MNYFRQKEPTSAHEVYLMSKQRNPIVETDKNMEKSLHENIKQTSLLNETHNINKETSKIVQSLSNIISENNRTAEKQFKITLIISIITGLFAAGSFLLALLQLIK
ncbi:hypothetical protein IJ579_05605 [bacterium]|nr:hypothetical protein [bacterium]